MAARVSTMCVLLAVVVVSGCRGGEPSSQPDLANVDAYVTGAGGVRLGMSEAEVSAALGMQPTRRQEAASPGDLTGLAWDGLKGAHPGAVLGRFQNGQLYFIELAAANLVLPRVGRDVARSLTTYEYVRRAVDKSLRMTDIEAVTHVRGGRASWIIARDLVTIRWAWEVEPGGEALIIEEMNGVAGQPVIRSLNR